MSSKNNEYNGGMNERSGDDLILERMYAREQVLLSQADALDMKASYLLVVLVFLAQLSTIFLLRPNLSCFDKGSQWLTCLLLLASGIFVLCELQVENFRGEDALELESWRDGVVTEAEKLDEYQKAPDLDDFLRSRVVWGLIEGSKLRIVKSEGLTNKKASRLEWAYWLTLVAFLWEVVTIVAITTHLL